MTRATTVINNAIAYSQFKLLGGAKNLAITSGAYAVIVTSVMFGFVYGLRQPPSRTYPGFVVLFFVLQCLTLLLYGMARIAAVTRADVRTRIIESHRLMPVSPLAAVMGYWLGAPLQAFIIFAINGILGAAATAGAGMPVQSWVFANGVILTFAMFVWAIVLFFAFRTPLALWGAMVALLAILLSQMQLLDYVPALNVLASPLIGHTVFDLRTGAHVEWAFVASLTVQGVIAGLYLLASSRRYERDDAVGFGPTSALLLLLTWVIASLLGLAEVGSFHLFRSWEWNGYDEAAVAASFTLTLLLSILPVASAARLYEKRSDAAGRRPLSPVWVVMLATVVALLVLYPVAGRVSWRIAGPLARSGLVIASFLLFVRYLLGVVHHARKPRPRIILLGWILLTWCGPLLIEAILAAMAEDPIHRHTSQIALCSPIVELFQIRSHDSMVHTEAFGGLAFQVGAAILMWVVYRVRVRRSRGLPTAADADAAATPIGLLPFAPDAPAEPTPVGPAAPK